MMNDLCGNGLNVTGTRIYFDQAATGWPKHESVYGAVEHQMRNVGAAAGRGSYSSAVQGASVLQEVRRRAAQIFCSDPQGVWVLAANGTAALNQAIHGVLRPGDHVVTTAADHNSVLRPIEWLRKRGMISSTIVACNRFGAVDPDVLAAAIRPETRLVAVTHGSNVTGAINPMQPICSTVRQVASQHCLILFDVAQTAGMMPIDIRLCDIDLLACPGHKGLGGPLGTGLLYVGPRAAEQIQPLIQGGTGSQSDSMEMPEQLPGKLESGNQNVPAFAGLAAALEALQADDLEPIFEANQSRTRLLAQRLAAVSGVNVITANQLPIISITHPACSPHDLAMILDSEFKIETRAGLHCAPLIHHYIGTAPEGSTRISFSSQTPDHHIDELVNAITQIVAG